MSEDSVDIRKELGKAMNQSEDQAMLKLLSKEITTSTKPKNTMGDSRKAAAQHEADRDALEEQILGNKTTKKFARLYKDLSDIKAGHRMLMAEHDAVSELMEKVAKLIGSMVEKPDYCKASVTDALVNISASELEE